MRKTSIITFLIILLIIPTITNASSRHSGKIYLQVEENGEAWYINPINDFRHYLGRPADAFSLMRSLGLGITNENLKQIPVGLLDYGTADTDMDGLLDDLEVALGTNVLNADTDSDDFSDKTEIENWYDPNGPDKLPVNNALIDRLVGRILLQVERNGEAWYLNPQDSKRYYLGRPVDAFAIMRLLGIGITNADLNSIAVDYSETDQAFDQYYSIKLPSNWSRTVVDFEENNYDYPYVHILKATDSNTASWLEIKVLDSPVKQYSLKEFDLPINKYKPIKIKENFLIGVKPAQKQSFKYDTIAEFSNVQVNKGKLIYVDIMLSVKKFIRLAMIIPNEADISKTEQIFNRILDSLQIKNNF